METNQWEQRYRKRERPEEDFATAPTPLVAETARRLNPARALDLACGTGRNAIWLAQNNWKVTAVDSSPTAIETLLRRAANLGIQAESSPPALETNLTATVANLEKNEFQITPNAWDLILICYYLQRNLFEPAKKGVAPNGIILAIAHITEANEEPTKHRLKPGELETYFTGWDILHQYEGRPNDPSHHRSVAEIVARRNTSR
ncbi:MAG: methyltransferase domain-containing protein [Candidatus Acidiferrales bacterium]